MFPTYSLFCISLELYVKEQQRTEHKCEVEGTVHGFQKIFMLKSID